MKPMFETQCQTFSESFNVHHCNNDMLLLIVLDRHRLAGQMTCHGGVLWFFLKAKTA